MPDQDPIIQAPTPQALEPQRKPATRARRSRCRIKLRNVSWMIRQEILDRLRADTDPEDIAIMLGVSEKTVNAVIAKESIWPSKPSGPVLLRRVA